MHKQVLTPKTMSVIAILDGKLLSSSVKLFHCFRIIALKILIFRCTDTFASPFSAVFGLIDVQTSADIENSERLTPIEQKWLPNE
jgi:hypothetical protein